MKKRIKAEKEYIDKTKKRDQKSRAKLTKLEEEYKEKYSEAVRKSEEAGKMIDQYSEVLEEQKTKLQRISGLSEEEAKKVLFEKSDK
ncbi:MAG: hypothetical protein R2942_16430 [Ignavibacteria bacterium]